MDLKQQQKHYFNRLYKRMKFFQKLMLVSVISLLVVAPFLAKEMSENKVIKKSDYAKLSNNSTDPNIILDLERELAGKDNDIANLKDELREAVRTKEDLEAQIGNDGDNTNNQVLERYKNLIANLNSDLEACKALHANSNSDQFLQTLTKLKNECDANITELKKELEVCSNNLRDINAKYEKCLQEKPTSSSISGSLKKGQFLQIGSSVLSFAGVRKNTVLMKSQNAKGFPNKFDSKLTYKLPNGQEIVLTLTKSINSSLTSAIKDELAYTIK